MKNSYKISKTTVDTQDTNTDGFKEFDAVLASVNKVKAIQELCDQGYENALNDYVDTVKNFSGSRNDLSVVMNAALSHFNDVDLPADVEYASNFVPLYSYHHPYFTETEQPLFGELYDYDE